MEIPGSQWCLKRLQKAKAQKKRSKTWPPSNPSNLFASKARLGGFAELAEGLHGPHLLLDAPRRHAERESLLSGTGGSEAPHVVERGGAQDVA